MRFIEDVLKRESMALIKCMECCKEISDKAQTCPNCGFPLSEEKVDEEKNNKEEIGGQEQLEYPNLPKKLDIGKQIVNWNFDAAFEGFYDKNENTLEALPTGKINVTLHTHGIQLVSGLVFYPISNHQIISLKTISKTELIKKDKSVIGRAVVGGLILGPIGAIVGGMSGIGSKESSVNQTYFIINYWDITTKSAKTILISSTEETKIKAFILRHKKEKEKNITENRVPESDTMPIWAILCIAIIIISVITIIFV